MAVYSYWHFMWLKACLKPTFIHFWHVVNTSQKGCQKPLRAYPGKGEFPRKECVSRKGVQLPLNLVGLCTWGLCTWLCQTDIHHLSWRNQTSYLSKPCCPADWMRLKQMTQTNLMTINFQTNDYQLSKPILQELLSSTIREGLKPIQVSRFCWIGWRVSRRHSFTCHGVRQLLQRLPPESFQTSIHESVKVGCFKSIKSHISLMNT